MRANRIVALAIAGILLCGSTVAAEAASLNSVIEMSDIADAEAKYTIIATIKGYVPERLLEDFIEHKGEIEIENEGYGTGGGSTTLILYDNDTIELPIPAHMAINTDGEKDQHVDDYVLHEFGHVFDAINGVTNDDLYREIIMSEMDVFNKAIAKYYEDEDHFKIPQEMFAEVFAAYIDPENVYKADEKLNAAPKTAKVIYHVMKEKGYKVPDNNIANTYKKMEYGSTEVVKRMDLVPDIYLRTVDVKETTYVYDSRLTDIRDDKLIKQLENDNHKAKFKFITIENKKDSPIYRKSVTLKN